jgi:hypothetical protein
MAEDAPPVDQAQAEQEDVLEGLEGGDGVGSGSLKKRERDGSEDGSEPDAKRLNANVRTV